MVATLETSDDGLAAFLAQAAEPDLPPHEMPTLGEIVTSALVSAAEELVYEDIQTTNGSSSGIDFTQFNVPGVIEDPSVAYVEPHEDGVEWQTYETFDETTLLLHGSITADLSVVGLVHKADYGPLDKKEIELVNWDWNDAMAQVVTSIRGTADFSTSG